MTLLAMVYTRTFYGATRAFRAMKIPPHVRPAIGAFASGGVGVTLYFLFHRDASVLAVMSYGYDALQNALSGGTAGTAAILMAIALGKIATTSLTIGSGGSGGVFGPSMVIGGCGGGALGIILHRYAPALVPNPATFVIVGMGGFFAAAAKTPFSTIVIVSEMTGGYGLLLPALWVCTLSFLLSDRMSIYGSQLESRASSPAHRRDILDSFFHGVRVAALLSGSPAPRLLDKDLLSAATEPLQRSSDATLPVVDDQGRYVGLMRATAALGVAAGGAATIADVMSTSVAPLRADEGIDAAMRAFVERDAASLPVVDQAQKLLGVVRRGDVAARYFQILHGEDVADPARRP
jgi:CIC family chloride channel protein